MTVLLHILAAWAITSVIVGAVLARFGMGRKNARHQRGEGQGGFHQTHNGWDRS